LAKAIFQQINGKRFLATTIFQQINGEAFCIAKSIFQQRVKFLVLEMRSLKKHFLTI
jgi:hypothetical protein